MRLFRAEIVLGISSTLVFLITGSILAEYFLSSRWVYSILKNPLPCPSEQVHRTEEYNVRYQIDEACFRGSDDRQADPEVMLLGDSFFFGVGVREGETVSRLIANEGFTLINAAENATNPPEYLIRAKKLLANGVLPDNLVIGLFIGNDFQGIEAAENIEALGRYQPPFGKPAPIWQIPRIREMLNWVIQRKFRPDDYLIRSFSYRRDFREDWLEWYADGDLSKANAARKKKYRPVSSDPEYFKLAEIGAGSIKNVRQIVTQIAQLNDAWSVVLLLIPDVHFALGELGPAYVSFYHDFVHSLPREIQVIDLHGKLKSDDYFINDGHWNASGHRKVAHEIMPLLQKREPESEKERVRVISPAAGR